MIRQKAEVKVPIQIKTGRDSIFKEYAIYWTEG